MRELSIKCHQNGLAFSVDNYVPMPYNTFYDLEEQSVFADYVVIMGYDEHVEGSYEAGSVASYGYVKDGIENALKSVPKEKLINAIPLYTRLGIYVRMSGYSGYRRTTIFNSQLSKRNWV